MGARCITSPMTVQPSTTHTSAVTHFGAWAHRSDLRTPTAAPSQMARSAPCPPLVEGTSQKSGV